MRLYFLRKVRRLRCAGALAFVLVGASSVLAQEQGPIIVGQKKAYDPFWMGNFQGSVDMLYEHTEDNISPKGSSSTGKQTVTTDLIQPTLSLSADGYIVHPNLVDLKMSGTFGVTQEWTNDTASTPPDQSALSTVDEYDISAEILKKEQMPVTVYSRRTEELIHRDFSGSLTNTSTTHGGSAAYRSEMIPSAFNVYYTEQRQSSVGGQQDYGMNDLVFEARSQAKIDPTQTLSLDYRFNDLTQFNSQGGTPEQFQVHDANAVHTVDFGENDRSNLLSTLNFFDQSGQLGLMRINWNENLRLQHTKEFQTNYRTTIDSQERPNSTQTLYRGSAGFTHQLYDSLTTSGNLGASLIELDSAQNTDLFGNLGVNYRKKVPYGRLTAGYTLNVDVQDNSANASPINEQQYTFDLFNIITLTQQNIDTTSIVIRDSGRIRTYILGIDYTVTDNVSSVEIRRVITGAIPDQANVIVSYRVKPQGANSIQTIGNGLSLRYDIQEGMLDGLGFYARFFHQDQTIDSTASTDPNAATILPTQIDDIIAGTDYHFWKVDLLAEYEIHDSTVTPFRSSRFQARYSDRFSSRTRYGVNLNYSIIDYPDDGNHVELLLVSGNLSHQITRELYAAVLASYREETNQLHGDTSGVEAQFDLNWMHRQTEVFASFRTAYLDSTASSDTHLSLRVGVKRKF